MTINQQLCLLVGVPSVFIVLSWLDSHRRFRRLSRKLDRMPGLRPRDEDENPDARGH